MASSSIETNEVASEEENKNVTASTGNQMMQSPFSIDAADVPKSKEKLSSSSSSDSTSSPDSPLDDPFREDKDVFQKSALSHTSLPEHDNVAQIDSGDLEKTVAGTSSPKNNAPTATESPPGQVMERNSDSKYRIPSHVFARSKSNTPEWSVASNDSLFSIQMGNMSFTKESFMLQMDEVGTPVGSSYSGHKMFSYSGPLPPSGKVDGKSKELIMGKGTVETPKEVLRPSGDRDQTQAKSVAENQISHPNKDNGSKAVDGKSNDDDAMKEFLSLKESEYQVHGKHTVPNGHISRLSVGSNNSTKSFAFPILDGADKGASISVASSPKLGVPHSQTPSPTATTPKEQEEPDQQPELNPPAEAQPQAGSSWLSCLPCCRR